MGAGVLPHLHPLARDDAVNRYTSARRVRHILHDPVTIVKHKTHCRTATPWRAGCRTSNKTVLKPNKTAFKPP